MRVTFTIQNLTETTITELTAMAPADAFAKLSKWAFGDLRHCVKQKIGTGQFREKVELNNAMRAPRFDAFKIEPRRGYKLATFEIERAA